MQAVKILCFYQARADHGRVGQPRFPGHLQPRVPLQSDLQRDVETARAYGIHGFCYTWGPDVPHPIPDFPFALVCVVDENWRPDRIQPFLEHPRCIRVDGRPMVLLRNSRAIPPATLAQWRDHARRHGLPGLHLVAVLGAAPAEVGAPRDVDAACELQPSHASRFGLIGMRLGEVVTVSTEEAWRRARSAFRMHLVQYRGTFATWDNTPVAGTAATIYLPPSPDTFRRHLEGRSAETLDDPALPEPFVFLNAWNAWDDGCAVAPDSVFGTSLVEAVRDARPARSPFVLSAGPLPSVARDCDGIVVLRVHDSTRPSPSWDRLAAALALESDLLVIDVDHRHHLLYPLGALADVVVVGVLHADLVDMLVERHRAGLANVFDPECLHQTVSDAGSGQGRAHERMLADLRPHVTALCSWAQKPDSSVAQVLEFYRSKRRTGEGRTLPPLPWLDECRRVALHTGPIESRLQAAKTPAALEHLLAQAPDYLQARLVLIRMLNDGGKGLEAEREARRVLSTSPHQGRVVAELGRALYRQRRDDEALRALLAAVELNPAHILGWVYLLRLRASVPGHDIARRAMDAHPHNFVVGLLAVGNDPDAAMRLLERVAPTVTPDEAHMVEESFAAVLDVARVRALLPAQSAPSGPPTFGVNLSGPLRSVTGLGQGARSVARVLQAAGVPCVLDNWTGEWTAWSEHSDDRYDLRQPYAVNVIHANADELEGYVRLRGEARLAGRYNVGIWNWELSTFPERWKRQFAHLQEVWTPSRFTRDSIASASPIPVHVMPYAVEAPPDLPGHVTRALFGLPARAFCFLFAFDLWSYAERKNPLAVVRAFRQAFGDRRDVHLAVKCLHAHDRPRDMGAVMAALDGAPNVSLILSTLSGAEMRGLVAQCDAFVSLHRSEGFGLPLAEAMLAGKPVIATAYSGNVDFMTPDNSLLVDYRLVPIERDHGPYRRGAEWADPDPEHAARSMQMLVDDRDLSRRLGERARRDIERDLSVEAVGRRMRERLLAIGVQPG